MVLLDGKGESWAGDAAPCQWTLPIPASAAGARTYRAVAIIDGAAVESNTVEITILLHLAGLQELGFQPAEQTVLLQDSEEQLTIFGSFADGQSRDITSQAMGTSYHERIVNGVEVTEGDSPATLVSADGKVTALAPGTVDDGSVTTARRFIVLERPVTVAEARDDAATIEEDHTATIEILTNDIGEGALAVPAVGMPQFGAAIHNGTEVTYTPPADWSGTDTFTCFLGDSIGATAVGTITVTVLPVNDPPVAVDDAATTQAGTAVTIDVLANDSDPDGDVITLQGVGVAAHGLATIAGAAVRYTPSGDWSGIDQFTYTVSDGNGGTTTATVTVTVTAPKVLRVTSAGTLDGWVLESAETGSRGGTLDARGTTLRVGDDALDKQYRAILSFDTAALPDNAVILSAKLRVRYQGKVGASPFATHGNLVVDVIRGAFSGKSAMQIADFQALAARLGAATILKGTVSGWYSTSLAGAWVNRGGLTQVRMRFSPDDNDDSGADYLMLYSGDAPPGYRPVLEVRYIVP